MTPGTAKLALHLELPNVVLCFLTFLAFLFFTPTKGKNDVFVVVLERDTNYFIVPVFDGRTNSIFFPIGSVVREYPLPLLHH
jgi:hypothetical protein